MPHDVEIVRQQWIKFRLVLIIVRIDRNVAMKIMRPQPVVNHQILFPNRRLRTRLRNILLATRAGANATIVIAHQEQAVERIGLEKLTKECVDVAPVLRMRETGDLVAAGRHGLGIPLGVGGGDTSDGNPQPDLTTSILQIASQFQAMLAMLVQLSKLGTRAFVISVRLIGPQLGHVSVADRHFPVRPHAHTGEHIHARVQQTVQHARPLRILGIGKIDLKITSAKPSTAQFHDSIPRDQGESRLPTVMVDLLSQRTHRTIEPQLRSRLEQVTACIITQDEPISGNTPAQGIRHHYQPHCRRIHRVLTRQRYPRVLQDLDQFLYYDRSVRIINHLDRSLEWRTTRGQHVDDQPLVG